MIISLILSFVFFPTQILAVQQYSVDEVGLHNAADDCWMIYEDEVYDLTEYLPDHSEFLEIEQWCGSDMTQDFKTKDDVDRDHRPSSYVMLDVYYIGDIDSVDEEVGHQESSVKNPYNLIIPLTSSVILYWVSYFICKKNSKILKFNAFWNTLLFLTLLIPSLGFGIFMMLRYKFPQFYNIDFNFMYWHVELSIVMGVIAISHFIQRFKVYLVQIKN